MSSNPKTIPFHGKRTELIAMPAAVRVDTEMRKKIEELAEAGERSMGKQLVRLIRLGIEVEEKKTA